MRGWALELGPRWHSRQCDRSRERLRGLQDLESGIYQGRRSQEGHQARRSHSLLQFVDGLEARDQAGRHRGTPPFSSARTRRAASPARRWWWTAGRCSSDERSRLAVGGTGSGRSAAARSNSACSRSAPNSARSLAKGPGAAPTPTSTPMSRSASSVRPRRRSGRRRAKARRSSGINDHYTVAGHEEFRRACAIAGIAATFSLEAVAMDRAAAAAGLLLNDPDNPGRVYLCGKGVTRIPPDSPPASRAWRGCAPPWSAATRR